MSFQQFRDEKWFIHTLVCRNTLSTIYLETDFVWVVVNVMPKAVGGMSNGNFQTWNNRDHLVSELRCEGLRGSPKSSAYDFPVDFWGFNYNWKVLHCSCISNQAENNC